MSKYFVLVETVCTEGLLFPGTVVHIILLSNLFFLSQSNLLASGANDSEIYIWDLNNFSSPMTPGAKTQVGVIERS